MSATLELTNLKSQRVPFLYIYHVLYIDACGKQSSPQGSKTQISK